MALASIIGVYAEGSRGTPLFFTYELYMAQALCFLVIVLIAIHSLWNTKNHGENKEGSPEVTTIGSALPQCQRITTVNGCGVSPAVQPDAPPAP